MAESRRTRRGGIRLRAAATATLIVAIVLAGAAAAFVLLQRRQLEASLTQVAQQQASAVADQVSRSAGVAAGVGGGGGDQSLIQVVSPSGAVLAASPSIEGEPPVVSLDPARDEVVSVTSDRLPIGEGDRFVVAARGVDTPDGPVVVLAAQSLESVDEATTVVAELLVTGYPLVLLAVGLTAYWLTGRALAPVEAIRRRVALIESAAELDARVPVPDGDDEISRLAVTMNSMLSRLQSQVGERQRFVSDASHELRSPLATIRAAHEIQALHPNAQEWPSITREVLSELDRLDRLVADMLLLARTDEHGLALRWREVDLDDVVEAEAARLRRGGLVEVSVTAPPVRVMADAERLARALRNLADNALRHAEHRIELRLARDDEVAVVEVMDDGAGVPTGESERVFERFVRLDQSRARDTGGSGMGLPIARQIVRAHHGDLVLGSSPSGARFVMTIPLAPRAQGDPPFDGCWGRVSAVGKGDVRGHFHEPGGGPPGSLARQSEQHGQLDQTDEERVETDGDADDAAHLLGRDRSGEGEGEEDFDHNGAGCEVDLSNDESDRRDGEPGRLIRSAGPGHRTWLIHLRGRAADVAAPAWDAVSAATDEQHLS